MRIVKLQAENLKRLVAVEITPAGDVVQITGKNGAGKTSVMDAISWALGGEKLVQAAPIRKGESSARATIDLGDYVVERRWTGKGSRLEVRSKEGAKYPSPQTLLDQLVGRLSFDPLAFMRLPAGPQANVLRDLAGIDTTDLDAEHADLYEQRRDTNRALKEARAQLSGLEEPGEDWPAAEAEASEILAAIEEARAVNEEKARARRRAEEAERLAEEIDRDVQQAQAAVAEKQRLLDDAKRALAEAKAIVVDKESEFANAQIQHRALDAEAEMMPDVDDTPLREQLAGLEESNRKARARMAYETAQSRVRSREREADEMQQAVEENVAARAKRIAEAPMPLADLSLGDDGVTYRGLPLEQASSAEQLRVSVAMAMALNPKLRVLRITDGSLLDSDSLRVIEEMAAEGDFQVWIEVVDESGQVGVFIEDGHVAAVDGAEVAA